MLRGNRESVSGWCTGCISDTSSDGSVTGKAVLPVNETQDLGYSRNGSGGSREMEASSMR